MEKYILYLIRKENDNVFHIQDIETSKIPNKGEIIHFNLDFNKFKKIAEKYLKTEYPKEISQERIVNLDKEFNRKEYEVQKVTHLFYDKNLNRGNIINLFKTSNLEAILNIVAKEI